MHQSFLEIYFKKHFMFMKKLQSTVTSNILIKQN